MAGLDFPEKINKSKARLKSIEQIAGTGLLQPFNNTNSGSRKLMHTIHRTHTFVLLNGEKAIIETGFENRFGQYSSSLLTADSDYQVIAKVAKFSFAPNHHYWAILKNLKTKELSVVERISYKHITESYGYLYNNDNLDAANIGSIIHKDDVIKKSLAFDDYGNRKDGVNLNVVYMALDSNMEDSQIFSDVGAGKMTAPLIKPARAIINENNIPLNIYGDDKVYKSFPDIGERIKDGNLLVLRTEKKEESLYMQSVERMKKPMISDDKYKLHGTVIDVDIYCNNPENLNTIYNGQFKMYYDELERMSKEIIYILTPYIASGYKMSYDLQKLFANSKRIVNKDQWMDKKIFSNIVIDIYVLEELPLSVGDKTANRFGGKGVVSAILPQHLMPQIRDGEYADAIYNSSTMYNRENPGQLIELSLNHCSSEIVNFIKTGVLTPQEAIKEIIDFLRFCSEILANELQDWTSRLSEEDLIYYIETVCERGNIDISSLPISESMDIDRLNAIYKRFPYIKQNIITVPIKDSRGNIRYTEARRPVIIAKQYTLRLKQFAEEKFSATSLSATNIRNENTKSTASRNYKEMFSNTPIKAGNMEIENESHLGDEHVIINLLLSSLSPHGRRLVEKFYTEDPFDVDIKLDKDSSNRSAETVNTYLKTIGLRIEFYKVKKSRVSALTFHALSFDQDALKPAIFFNDEKDFDFLADSIERENRRLEGKGKGKEAIRFDDNPTV